MIHVIICGWRCEDTINRCLESIHMQKYNGIDVTKKVTIDWDNNRRYLLSQTADAIRLSFPRDDDIIACVDADDFLCDEMALQIIADAYAANPDLLLTYGSYVNLSSNKAGKFCKEYQPGEEFRTTEWRGSHLKTFKYKLWKQVPDAELRDQNGEYFKCCADRAMMIPMMELAGHDRIAHIPMILYCYNDLNPLSVWNTMRQLSKETRQYISSRRPLSRLEKI